MRLLTEPIYAVASTVLPNGQPHSTIVWVDYDGQHVRFNTARGRQKDKNLQKNPRVTIMLVDPKDPYFWMEIRGIGEITEQGGRDHIESLSRRYTGQQYYGGYNKRTNPDQETRVTITVKATKVLTYPRQP
jgi:PPOX class probable F420-dependent enzyme